MIECLDVLKGGGPPDLVEVSVELAARMLVLGRVAADRADAERQVRGAIASGAGLDRFRRIIEAQGGDPRVVDDYSRLPPGARAPCSSAQAVPAIVSRLDAELVGRASVALGAGRDRVEDPVDPAVGIMVRAKPGTEVRAGDPVLEMHYRDGARLDAALALATRAVTIHDERPRARPAHRRRGPLMLGVLQPLFGAIVILCIAVVVFDQPPCHQLVDGGVGPRPAGRSSR